MQFSQPLTILPRPGESPIVFEASVDLISWLQLQSEEWARYTEAVQSVASTFPNAGSWISDHTSKWQSYAATARTHAGMADESKMENALREHLSYVQHLMNQKEMIWSGDSLAQKALALSEIDPTASVFIFLSAVGHIRWMLVANDERRWWSEFSRAIIHLHDPKSVSAFLKRQREAISSSEKLASQVAKQIEDNNNAAEMNHDHFSDFMDQSSKDFLGLVESSKKQSDEKIAEISTEWSKLRATYDAELKLRAPRKYWEQKYVDHQDTANGYRKAFFAVAGISSVVISIALAALVCGWVPLPKELGSYQWVVPAAVLGVPVFFSLWLLRFFGRQWSDQLMRREDARERRVMIETFLAISRDSDSPGAVTDPAQLGLILSSIFRPGPGLAADDSPPAGFFDAMLSKLSK